MVIIYYSYIIYITVLVNSYYKNFTNIILSNKK